MQCPTCQQELANQTHCENCNPKDVEFADATLRSKGNAEQGFADDSNNPLARAGLPQAADSVENPSGRPIEAEVPTGVDEQRRQEPASPPLTVETTVSGNSINSKGDLSIIGQIGQTIEDIRQTEVRESSIQAGHDVITANKVIFQTGGTSIKAEEEPFLYSLTRELPPRVIKLHESAQIKVRETLAQLKATRLMFITCPYAHFAVDAGHIAIEGLGLDDPSQKRQLYYEDAARKGIEFSVPKLLDQIPEEEDERAILVYAQSSYAQSFFDSFFDTPSRIDSVLADLKRSHLFLIVIVAPQSVINTLGSLKRTPPFAYAEIPFLSPFLRQHYPDYERLEAEIIAQWKLGKWEKEETNFCQQILDLHETEQLEDVVAAGGPDDPRLSAESLLKESGRIEKTVLYTAAFFQEVTVSEFCSVIEVLLDGRGSSVAASSYSGAPTGTQAELPLSRIWEEEKDNIFNKWLRETSIAKDSVRVVTLSNSALREPLGRLFKKQHRFYLIDQFTALEKRGVFFHPSIRLAENMTNLTVQMAGSFPDKFNENWVLDLVRCLRRHFALDPSDATDGDDGSMFQFLQSSQPGAFNLALSRVSAVLRRMLESPQLKGMVQSSLEQFIKCGYHEEALLLIKQLQFTPEFDELYWFKQLLHRANNKTRHLTYYYLYAYLKRMGTGAYEMLKKIETWLPPAERTPDSYSQFDYFVLRLLIQYCVETVARFNTDHYGDWPSRYPLLMVEDADGAAERTSLLARWLLHPGIEVTLARLRMDGTQMTLIGALLAEWAFILLGPEGGSAVKSSIADRGNSVRPGGAATEGTADAQYSAIMLVDLLVSQFTSRTNLVQRLELLSYWNRLDHDLLKHLLSLPRAGELRNQLSWKRDVVCTLIKRIKRGPLK